MRTVLVAVLLVALAFTRPASAATGDPGAEFGLAIGAAAGSLLYTPAKLIVAVSGLAVGGLVGVLTGGDIRAAYGVWVPAASGTYMLHSSHLDGTEPIEFFGTDYADRPSKAGGGLEGHGLYEAQYSM